MLKKTLCTLTLTMLSSAVMASGYQISEYSATNLGRSFAGAGVVGDDFSALGYNPAGMQANTQSGLQAGASFIGLHSDYEDKETFARGSSRMYRVLPQFFGQYKLNNQWTLGAGVYTPYGLLTDYDNDWTQKAHGLFSGLKVVDMAGAISYQPHKMVSLGASVFGQSIDARLTSATNDLRGDDLGAGYLVGLTLSPMDRVSFGVSYRSAVHHDIEGKIRTMGTKIKAHAKLTTPELVLLSAKFNATNKLTLSATARWTKWSRFKNLNVQLKQPFGPVPTGTIVSSTHENWKNAWFYSIGADYKIDQNWTVRLGTAYDETVIKAPEFRTVRVPDGRRYFLSAGLSYATGNWQYDLGYLHVWMRHGDAKGAERGKPTPDVHYNDAGAYMAAFSLQYKF